MTVGMQGVSGRGGWTDRRLRTAGLAAALGSGAFGAFVLGLSLFGVTAFDAGTGATTGVAVAHALGYALMLLALVAAHASYGDSLGRAGRVISALVGASLVALIVSMVLIAFPVASEAAVEAVAGVGFVFGHLLPSVYGIVLLRRVPRVGRPTAWLFVAVAPALVLVLLLAAAGLALPPGVFEVVLAAAFAALGHDVWRCAQS